jgi:hypothetical protein
MKLYNKHLNSLDELKTEKHALKKQLEKIKSTPIKLELSQFSGNTILGKTVSVINGVLAKKEKLSTTEIIELAIPSVIALASTGKIKRIVRKMAIEFVGGYLKWKMLYGAIRFAQSKLSRKKEA